MKRINRSLLKLGIVISAIFGTNTYAAVDGYVDLHSHLMGEHAFGGSWFWGTAEGPIQSALARCDGNFGYWPGEGSHAATKYPLLSEFLGADTGWHLGRRRGYDNRRCRYFLRVFPIPGTCPRPHFEHWPNSDAIAHQQMWYGHLQKAKNNGLRIMGVSLYESEFLCKTTPPLRRRYDCNEIASVKRQANFVRGFAARNSSWVGIAETPAQARALISQGKLALVLTAELTKLFPDGNYIQQLDELHALGVRSLQLVHHANNRFSGTAPINQLRTAATAVEILSQGSINTDINDTTCRDSNGAIQYEYIPGDRLPALARPKCDGESHLNEQGLTAAGIELVNAMVDRGMILDVSHLSRKAFRDTYQIAMRRGRYPLTYSHAHMWSMMEGKGKEERNEKYLRDEEIHMITDTGGMIGLRTGHEKTLDNIRPPLAQPLVANTCQSSSRSFAQSLTYAIDKGLNVGFGADFNGFIAQMYGLNGLFFFPGHNCYGDFVQVASSGGFNEFHAKGFGHVGLFPEFIADLKRVGVPASYMNHIEKTSAEIYLQIWERSLALAGGGPSPNVALSATATASTTFCVGPPQTSPDCYAAWRVNDGNPNSTLGGQNSWANDRGAAMPQWVELTWNTPITASRVVVTTSAGFPIQDYDIEYWDGSGWMLFERVRGNTRLSRPHTFFTQLTTTRMRILGLQGPINQPGYVRINEFEVYPN
jgi:microsomal dipeptidase-like Zn-dependent dipeptidase